MSIRWRRQVTVPVLGILEQSLRLVGQALINPGARADKSCMRVSRLFLSILISASAMSTSACTNALNDLLGSSPTTPSSSTPTTDTFNGSLAPNSSVVFTFSVGTSGSVAVTLTAVSPATTGPLGLGVGPSSNGTCTIANQTSGAIAALNPQLSTTENPGTYCVKVSDAGTLVTASSVTVTVSHP